MLLPVLKWEVLRQGRGLKVLLISFGGVIALAGAGAVTYCLWPDPPPKPPPAPTASIDKHGDYVASGDFNRLPLKQRVDWVEGEMHRAVEMNDDEFVTYWKEMDEAKRDRIRRNLSVVMREIAKRQVTEYFKLSPEERADYIDDRIDEEEEWASKIEKMLPNPRKGSRGWDLRQKERIAGDDAHFKREAYHFMRQPADQRSKMVTYFSAYAKRWNERGLSRVLGFKLKRKKKH